MRIPIKSQIPIFPQVHKHELRPVQQRRELAICQCHCQCYLIACLKCVWLSLSHQFQSQQENLLKPVNLTGETTKHWKGLMSNNQQLFRCQISRSKSNLKKYWIAYQSLAAKLTFKLSNHSQKVFISRFKSQLQLVFAHHCYMIICHSWRLWILMVTAWEIALTWQCSYSVSMRCFAGLHLAGLEQQLGVTECHHADNLEVTLQMM